jgi:hypothetical protein
MALSPVLIMAVQYRWRYDAALTLIKTGGAERDSAVNMPVKYEDVPEELRF